MDQGQDRRRNGRIPMNLDALISVGGRPPFACTVRDFCGAGMFIAVDARELRTVNPQDRATLYFAVVAGDERRELQLTLSVSRVIPSGLGVAFDDPDPATVELLQEIAGPPPLDPESLTETQRRFAPEFARVLPRMSSLVEKTAEQLAVEFTRHLGDALFAAARDSKSNRDMSLFTDVQNELRRRADNITRRVPQTLVKAAAILGNPLAERAAPAPVTSLPNLSLVDKEEFEEFLSVSEAVSELETRHKEALHSLSRRLGVLARRPLSDADNPVGPAVVCHAFAEELKGMLTNRGVSDLAYKSLRRLAEPHLGRLYDDLNQLLIDNGIQPVLEQEKLAIKPLGAQRRADAPSPPLERTASGGLPSIHDEMLNRLSSTNPLQATSPAGMATAPPGGAPAPAFGMAATPWFPGVPGGQGLPGGLLHGGAATAPGGLGGEVAFGGFGYGPSVAVMPTLEQAYQTAQAQLALRRQLAPDLAATPVPDGATYSTAQLAHGLTGLQRALLEEPDPKLFDAEEIKERLAATLAAEGVGGRAIGQAESDAIEVIVGLFEALLRDSMLADFSKAQLKRLQPSVHRAALLDEDFFASTHHPLRQLLNRIALLRQEQGPDWQQLSDRVRGLLDSVSHGPEAVQPVVSELDDIIREQRRRYESNVQQVIAGCNEQQAMLRERREKSGVRPGESTSSQQELSPEWNRWLNRSKALHVGDRMLMDANARQPVPVTLVWIGEEFNPYVFVDPRGAKVSTLTLQQVAMYLRRGLLKPLPDDGAAAVDRALFGVVNRFHEQAVEQAHHDTLTGLLNRKSFMHALEERLPATARSDTGTVLCQIAIDNLKAINEQHGLRAGDAILRRVAETLRNRYGKKPVTLGRLGGGEVALYWERGGLQAAYKDVQDLCATLNLIESLHDGDALPLKCVAGLMAVEDGAVKPVELLNAVGEACLTARGQHDKPVYIAGADSAHRKQLAQLMGYVAKAIEKDRLALLYQEVRAQGRDGAPAAFVVVSAEDRNGKLVPPTLFSQAAAASERAYDIDVWALKHTLGWMARNEEAVERFSAFIVPLSRAALVSDSLANTIIAELMQTAVPPSKICFEIADKDAVTKLTETADLVNTLREFGCQFILGNFGGARTNYEYLKELAVDYVSIQQDFIDDARQNQKDFAMAKSMNELIHFMGKATIARQTAEANVADLVKALGIDFIHDQTRATRLAIGSTGA
jgi:diguanylate cyclase (GGDEF)-like protein